MHVTFIPDYTAANPYQRLLADALHDSDVQVEIVNASRYFFRLSSVFKNKKRPDILHIHWTEQMWVSHRPFTTLIRGFFFTLELLFTKLRGTKLVWTVHNLVKHDSQTPQIEKFFNSIFCILYDKIIVHCVQAKEIVFNELFLPLRYSKKFRVIPHGFFVNYYKNLIPSDLARKELNIKPTDKVFLFFGVIRPYKGIIQLIRAINSLPQKDIKLLIVGKPMNDEIRQTVMKESAADDRILLHLRYTDNNEIQSFMNAADVAVLPYQSILTSGAAYLAMSFGKAIIAPAMGCNIDLAPEGTILYDSSKPEGLIDAIKQALMLPLEQMGSKNMKKANELDWHNISKKTFLLYQNVLSRKIES